MQQHLPISLLEFCIYSLKTGLAFGMALCVMEILYPSKR